MEDEKKEASKDKNVKNEAGKNIKGIKMVKRKMEIKWLRRRV